MSKITRVGVDLAKTVIQVHAVDAAGRVLVRRALKRDMFIDWCVQLDALVSAALGVPGKAGRRSGLLPARRSNAAWRGERGAGERVACSPRR